MIISTSPDHLLTTAELLLETTFEQYNFLQIHGGLHYGKLLKRNNSYFGAALNLTARIASQATAGTFLCSQEFIDVLSDKFFYKFESKGKYNFKNVADEKKIFEIVLEKPNHFHIDPICRMIVSREADSLAHPEQSNLLFCSQNCLDIYLRNNINQRLNT
jgi:class 3 adenylate cyclase/YHS domain-containing protein